MCKYSVPLVMWQCHSFLTSSVLEEAIHMYILCPLSLLFGKLLVTPFHENCKAYLCISDQLLPLCPCLLSFVFASLASTVGHPQCWIEAACGCFKPGQWMCLSCCQYLIVLFII